MNDTAKMMTTEEVAEYLHCSTHYVGDLRKTGYLTGIRVGKRWLYATEDVVLLVLKNKGKEITNLRDRRRITA